MRSILRIKGNVLIPDLNWYRVEYGEGLEPTRWTQIGSKLRTQPVANDVLDGVGYVPALTAPYTIRVTARDTSGQEQEVRAHVTIDNTVPQVELLSPREGTTIFPVAAFSSSARAAAETLDRVDFYVRRQADCPAPDTAIRDTMEPAATPGSIRSLSWSTTKPWTTSKIQPGDDAAGA